MTLSVQNDKENAGPGNGSEPQTQTQTQTQIQTQIQTQPQLQPRTQSTHSEEVVPPNEGIYTNTSTATDTHTNMGKWHNASWTASYPTAANPSNWHNPPQMREPYAYSPPVQGKAFVNGSQPAKEVESVSTGATSPPRNTLSGGPAPLPQTKHDKVAEDMVPRPMMNHQPFPQIPGGYVNPGAFSGPPTAFGPYTPMHLHQYPMGPPEYSGYGNFQPQQSEPWDSSRHHMKGGIIKGTEEPPAMFEKHLSRDSSNSSPNTDTASGRDVSETASDTSQGTSDGKVTRRSRMGCLTCRQRKKRCCETRPQCTECSRLRLKCVWPKPGTEHKNKPKEIKCQENMIDHDVYGKIKVLRGIVEYRSD
ncbi:hypothetical protein JCM33374_g4892 [Metschnikowia sp. JCM 33374]|nr:hypothetical protein JCM33374_g4892 [Metschnikowia sp. JCM 33374]